MHKKVLSAHLITDLTTKVVQLMNKSSSAKNPEQEATQADVAAKGTASEKAAQDLLKEAQKARPVVEDRVKQILSEAILVADGLREPGRNFSAFGLSPLISVLALQQADLVRIKTSNDIWSIDVAPNGQSFIATGIGGDTTGFSFRGANRIFHFAKQGNQGRTARYLPSGDRIAISSKDGIFHIWDPAHPQVRPTATERLGPEPKENRDDLGAFAFSPDGLKLVSGGDDGIVRIWNQTGNGTLWQTMDCEAPPIIAVAYSADGSKLAARCGKGRVRVWDVGTRKMQWSRDISGATQQESVFAPRSIAFTPTGKQVLTVGDDHIVRRWNAITGGSTEDIRGDALGQEHWSGGRVVSVVVAPDGRWATASEDGHARLYDSQYNLQLLVAPSAPNSSLRAVEFSRDGKSLLLAATDRTLTILPSEPNVLFSSACQLLQKGETQKSIQNQEALKSALDTCAICASPGSAQSCTNYLDRKFAQEAALVNSRM